MLLISVRDRIAGTWSLPTVVQNKESAVRDFRNACRNPKLLLGENPEDFELWLIGEWTVPYESTEMPKLSPFKQFEFVEAGVKHDK